jgi:uncharacterized membrane protein
MVRAIMTIQSCLKLENWRIISQFRKSFFCDKFVFTYYLHFFFTRLTIFPQPPFLLTVNQSLAHEVIALQILDLLLERPTDDDHFGKKRLYLAIKLVPYVV